LGIADEVAVYAGEDDASAAVSAGLYETGGTIAISKHR
jgi:hypothetical protein